MSIFIVIVLIIMIIGAIAAAKTKNILSAIIIFMVYTMMMSILWQQLNAPDLAITEVSVGTGITSILFLVTYRKIKVVKK
ncbi:Na(+)/H(+) antiporter subunit B [Fusibacter bizertensis]